MNRNLLITSFISHVADQTSLPGTRGLKFLNEINDFPGFYVHPKIEALAHYGSNNTLRVIRVDLRIFTMSDDIETLARNVETAVQTFRSTLPCIDEARVTSLNTDNGLLDPYAVADLEIEIYYRKAM